MERQLRLGDDIDDYCVKCKRLTNHLVVAFHNSAAGSPPVPAKVRCRSCYHEHDYLNETPPPKKKR